MRRLAVLLAAWTVAAPAADIPAIPEVPAALAAARPDLAQRRARLVQERKELRQRTDAHNAGCRSVEEGSAAEASCSAALAGLKADLSRHVAATRELAAALAAASASGAATFDSRSLVTPDEYRDAKAALAVLEQRRERFERKLAEVRGWRSDLSRHYAEFEAMRQEAQRDLIYEFLDHAPVGWGLGQVNGARLTPATRAQVEAGWEALKAVVNTGRALSAQERSEQVAKVVEGNLAARKALVAIPREGLTPQARLWLDGFGKVYDVSAKVLATSAKEQVSYEEIGNTLVAVGEVLVPPAGLAVMAQHGALRGASYWSASRAQSSLGEALSANWNAERAMREKLEQLDSNIQAVKLTVEKYCGAHPGTADCG